jgi:hypothetical protein
MPFVEVLGNIGTVPLPQITKPVPKLKTGVTLGVTIIVMVSGKPH